MIQDGRDEGRVQLLVTLIQSGDISLQRAAALMNMTPEEFAHALAETVDTDAAAEREYLQEQMRMVQEAAAAPDEIYRMLEQFDLPNSAMNVNAIQSMMANRNQLFRQIFGEESTNPDREKKITAEDIEAIKESIIEDFG